MTTTEVCALYKITRQRLGQLRNGYNSRGIFIKPQLNEGMHYRWERGDIIYDESEMRKYFESKRS